MSQHLTLYTWPHSRGAVVQYMFEELGVPYEMRLLNLQKGDHRTPEFAAINPMGKVPALVVGDTVITEVAAICAWLADAFPAAGLAPEVGSAERGTYYRWLFFNAGCLEPAMFDHAMKRPDAERTMIGYGSYDTVMNVVSDAVSVGPWLLGEKFSAADVMIGSYLDWGRQFKMLEPTREISAYLDRMAARPAWQRSESENARILADAQIAAG